MAESKSYFVAVDKQDIQETSMPDRGIEYEIKATPDEVEEIKELFAAKNKDGRKAIKHLVKPFDELSADEKRNQYDGHLITIYRRLFELGTSETKRKISEIGLFK
ncbi:hypothetical protein [Virgibacillus doumboii]|uniref:hypothetical protein n=1 Tax=Virgibacillus doumboii TaxID=2697503 RepID=UPI0013E00BE0|nr:hypothetical protein [Virgibacillus doumboii]